jgi:hypothetical protein
VDLVAYLLVAVVVLGGSALIFGAHIAAFWMFVWLLEVLGRWWLALRGRSRTDDARTGRDARTGFLVLCGAICAVAYVASAVARSEVARQWRGKEVPVVPDTFKGVEIIPAARDSDGRVWDEQGQRWLSPASAAIDTGGASRWERIRRERAERTR